MKLIKEEDGKRKLRNPNSNRKYLYPFKAEAYDNKLNLKCSKEFRKFSNAVEYLKHPKLKGLDRYIEDKHGRMFKYLGVELGLRYSNGEVQQLW